MDTDDRQAGGPAYFRGRSTSLWTEAITRRQRTRGNTMPLNEQTRINITAWAEEYISGVVENHHGDREDVRAIVDHLHDQVTFADHDSGPAAQPSNRSTTGFNALMPSREESP